ncbi:MAG: DUF5666 domain-containing protein [Candidatus Paceibacterota bacterium]
MKKTLIIVGVLVLLGAGAFLGGMKFGESKKSNAGFPQGEFQNMQQGAGAGLTGSGKNGGGLVNGDILSKDDKSITVKLRDGGSKIVLFSDTTEISKFVSGTSADLEVGKTVTITGKTNQDGSVTAQSIQLKQTTSTQP